MDDLSRAISVEEFLDLRFELPESGQWSELEAGRVIHLQPPDLDHGNTILNLAKVLTEYASTAAGYACFDLGLILQRNPDTVRFPAVSYFVDGPRFAEMDRPVTTTIPAMAIQLASTADRRRQIGVRVEEYLAWGVRAVWVIDPSEHSVQVFQTGGDNALLNSGDTLEGGPVLSGLRFDVARLFTEPEWWK